MRMNYLSKKFFTVFFPGTKVQLEKELMLACQESGWKEILQVVQAAFFLCFGRDPESIEWFLKDQAFSSSYDLAPPPSSPPSPIRKIDRRHSEDWESEPTCSRGKGEGCGRSQIVRGRESMVLYKSFSNLCIYLNCISFVNILYLYPVLEDAARLLELIK